MHKTMRGSIRWPHNFLCRPRNIKAIIAQHFVLFESDHVQHERVDPDTTNRHVGVTALVPHALADAHRLTSVKARICKIEAHLTNFNKRVNSVG